MAPSSREGQSSGRGRSQDGPVAISRDELSQREHAEALPAAVLVEEFSAANAGGRSSRDGDRFEPIKADRDVESGSPSLKSPTLDDSHAASMSDSEQNNWNRHQRHQQAGVSKMEALYRVFGGNRTLVWSLYVAVAAIVMCFCFDGSTTSQYQIYGASSFGEHAFLLSFIDTAESIIIAVSKPFIAKVCDVSSRQTAYMMILVFYVVGYAIVAASPSVGAFAAGRIISATGQAGLDLVTDIIVADISPLQWRALVTAATSSPYLFLSWIGPNVSGPLIAHDPPLWRWGFGMFCIIAPVCVMPAVIIMYIAERKAKKNGQLAFGASLYERRLIAADGSLVNKESKLSVLRRFAVEMDLIGLFLLTLSWCLIFLPFSLASRAKGKWANPSIIAMLVCGFVILGMFAAWEIWGASQPIMNRRILKNRTFQLAVTIDIFYFLTGTLRSTYYSSYVYVVKQWTEINWGYYINIGTFGLTLFGLCAGVLLRITHRYKYLQVFGLTIRLVGNGVALWARGANANNAALIWVQILIALGGSCSVVGTRVASQASVPHQDLASVIALLSLWSKLGSSVGSAIAGAVWAGTMRDYMREEGVPPNLINSLYGSVKNARKNYPLEDPIRQSVIRAYNRTVYPLFLAATIVSVVPLLAGLFMPNYYLGKSHNKIENTDVGGRRVAGEGPGNDPTTAPGEAPSVVAEPERPKSRIRRVFELAFKQ
ncbi:MFS general substrate transporter [Ceraceosorus guamensis]|uniref:MFS general substrate transporter n=1 Tax=Ceraceosorus guamensis TaxID=1522189 RepID=A0A316VUX2_9BASI|nr:MFS general substrate transporter [Ceraceosorus guamensis]PWN41064.1 MFS general substrate transporter [Ceraceosorus guamensis]